MYKKQKEKEYFMLNQGSMTVRKYEYKLKALSRFSSRFIQNEEDMCSQFHDGLELVIKSWFSTLETTNYSVSENKDIQVEKDVDEVRWKQEQGTKRSRFDPNYQNGSDKEYTNTGGTKFQYSRGMRSSSQRVETSSGRGSKVLAQGNPNTCFFCGTSSHIKRNCPKLLNIKYFNYHHKGHLKKNYTMLSREVPVSSLGPI